jgi:SAM-dependent methyltransferase
MSSGGAIGAASFRDPDGRLFIYEGRILRAVSASGRASLEAFASSAALRKLRDEGGAVGAQVLSPEQADAVLADARARQIYQSCAGGLLVEHDAIPFPSYPAEWPAEMLHAAGEHTIELAQALLEEGLGLKDATPYNILFRGPQPVFVDALSVERRESGDPIWLPYAQFERTFVLPLLANRYFGVPLAQIFANQRDGLEAEELYRMTPMLRRLAPPFLGAVSLPAWLGKRHAPDDASIYQPRRVDPEQAKFILKRRLLAARKRLRRAAPRPRTSDWAEYAQRHSYSDAQSRMKEETVERVLRESRPQRVLDVGCNTGRFSLLAAETGAEVVAIDVDPVSVGRLWWAARGGLAKVLPLVVNLARPTPAMGWRNQETASFLDRARGRFECVLMLAVLHHLLVTERVPLEEVIDLAADLTQELLVIEFVAPEDAMFRRITRGREHLHAGLNTEVFERAAGRRFEKISGKQIAGTQRWMYLLRRRR